MQQDMGFQAWAHKPSMGRGLSDGTKLHRDRHPSAVRSNGCECTDSSFVKGFAKDKQAMAARINTLKASNHKNMQVCVVCEYA